MLAFDPLNRHSWLVTRFDGEGAPCGLAILLSI